MLTQILNIKNLVNTISIWESIKFSIERKQKKKWKSILNSKQLTRYKMQFSWMFSMKWHSFFHVFRFHRCIFRIENLFRYASIHFPFSTFSILAPLTWTNSGTSDLVTRWFYLRHRQLGYAMIRCKQIDESIDSIWPDAEWFAAPNSTNA